MLILNLIIVVKNKCEVVSGHFYAFILAFFLLFCGISSTLSGQQNIAVKADGVYTSHVSPWETLDAVNDGFEPSGSGDKTHGAYGNWTGNIGVWNWVEYNWEDYYVISQSEVYWWTDGGGIQIPDSSFIEYWDVADNTWLEVPNHNGYKHLENEYSVVAFDEIYTNKIRLHCKSNTEATGILEWKVVGDMAEKLPGHVDLDISNELALSTTSTVTLSLKDNVGNAVTGYNFVYDVIITNSLKNVNESFQVNGVNYSESAGKVRLLETDDNGKISFDIVLPASIDPGDGISIELFYNNGLVKAGSEFSFYQPAMDSPMIVADNTNNSVDFDIELTFVDNPDWRKQIYEVTINNQTLDTTAYDLTSGKISLKPSSLNPALTGMGLKTVKIFAYGYGTVSIEQQINAGELSTERTKVGTYLVLTKNQFTQIFCEANDQYNNPIPGLKFLYDIEITNSNSTSQEQYVINGRTSSVNSSANQMGESSDEGYAEMDIQMPSEIDINDGIVIKVKTEEGQLVGQVNYEASSSEKSVYVQRAVRNHPDFSWERTAQSENFILYWGSKIEGDPISESNGNLKFDPVVILNALETVMSYWTDSINFIDNPDEGNMAKYKFEAVLNETWSSGFGGWAFGGSADDVIGSMWIHPQAASGGVGALAHEFGHMCQAMILIQNPGYGLKTPWAGFFWESHTCFMDWFYKDYGFDIGMSRYIMTSSMQYSTTRRHYQNVLFLQYLYDKYGLQTINDIWKNANPEMSHPLTSLRDSVLGYTQSDLNDDFGHHAMRNVTWDYSNKDLFEKYVNKVDQSTINRRYTILERIKNMDDWYIVPREMAPADYGFNIIPFYPDSSVSQISIDFYGYENEPAGGAGWRYGIVEVDNSGTPTYGELQKSKEGTLTYSVANTDNEFYFVVSGAPAEHHNYFWEPGFPKIYRYPYKVRFNGAKPAGHKVGYNRRIEENSGTTHVNGGGWVASTANVESSVYVGPNAQVLGNALVRGNVRIEDYAIVKDDAQVSGNAIIKDWALVGKNAVVKDNVIVEKRSRVYTNCEISENALVTGSAIVYYGSKVKGDAVAKDLAFLFNLTLSGTAVLGGDGEEFQTVSEGIYLQVQNAAGANRNGVDGLDFHLSNVDINPTISDYFCPNGDYPTGSFNLKAENIQDKSVALKWDTPESKYGIKKYYVLQEDNVKEITTSNAVSFSNLISNYNYTFRVVGIDSLGNYTPYSNSVTFQTLVTSISSEIQEHDNFKISNLYPQQRICVIAPDINRKNILEIYTISGQLVYKKSFVAETSVNHSAIGGSGIYLVKVNNGEIRENSKVYLNN
ncbi:Por secretion system C-terminal sorting domain-containing protein [Mariniphaga anaerophila]|uniref:Por secretion system C-terminal sorting domain-containing protein n=1 Tax=Mariniphaga anaerophila TaxID=1484053 RepID=A0A1M5FMD2_9BACT|nr:DUF6055 domain-containing protein [Mariniphaga anaerophila]SHF92331.1 Por secretion system C-terminal sorting domain-containing protein [Mariniphaga anaerophila]